VKILPRREQFEQMREKNPAVEALRQAFDLELA
jgi:DNA polymerase-3 subunit gamma/tau